MGELAVEADAIEAPLAPVGGRDVVMAVAGVTALGLAAAAAAGRSPAWRPGW
ncbi:MAG: hypothetical protein ABMA64_29985 [Myxococcota bacterium]